MFDLDDDDDLLDDTDGLMAVANSNQFVSLKIKQRKQRVEPRLILMSFKYCCQY